MEYREIVVTVLSAQDLKNVNLLGWAMNPYAEVWIYSSKKERTRVCSGGGRNPSWDCSLKLACEDRLFGGGGELQIAVYNRGSIISSNTLIGTVAVPLSDLVALRNAADDSQSSMSMAMSCQILTKSGKTQGVLNLAVKVGAMVKQAEQHYKAPTLETYDTAPVMRYPATGPYSRRYLAQLDKKDHYYPADYHPRYGQPAFLYQQAPSLKLQMWLQGPKGRGDVGDLTDSLSDLAGSIGGGCGGGCG
ncbi:hypothetical protein KC19_8G183800 [Ceratodon purpureus]|uniref:C2 domain-containing protein n=1 Tax=Ceratodon purpureus TaxID=3225 RepID=A0A8T0H2D9_CERPU|nr:hypothetical protein KC19_8G183800 [Ceratodon purpureus]